MCFFTYLYFPIMSFPEGSLEGPHMGIHIVRAFTTPLLIVPGLFGFASFVCPGCPRRTVLLLRPYEVSRLKDAQMNHPIEISRWRYWGVGAKIRCLYKSILV